MTEAGNTMIGDACMDKELLTSMEKSLPMYAVKCFVYAGYDNIPAITQMTAEGPQNSLDQIEEFILKYYPSDKSCYPPTIVGSHNEATSTSTTPKFAFLPGHRILLGKFINDIKVKHTLNIKISRKRHNDDATSHPSIPKKQKIVCTVAEDISTNQCYDLGSLFQMMYVTELLNGKGDSIPKK